MQVVYHCQGKEPSDNFQKMWKRHCTGRYAQLIILSLSITDSLTKQNPHSVSPIHSGSKLDHISFPHTLSYSLSLSTLFHIFSKQSILMVWLSAAATLSSLICLLFFVFINGAFCARSLPPQTCSTRPLPQSTPTTRPQSSPTCLTRPLPPSTQTCPTRPSPPPSTVLAELDDKFVFYKKIKRTHIYIYIYQMFICSSRYGVLIYEARVCFGTQVRVRNSVIFEKCGCGCGGTWRLKNY